MAERQQRSEIGICRDDDTLLSRGAIKNDLILRFLQAVITHVDRVMSRLPEALGHYR